jgi:hypothetical protein
LESRPVDSTRIYVVIAGKSLLRQLHFRKLSESLDNRPVASSTFLIVIWENAAIFLKENWRVIREGYNISGDCSSSYVGSCCSAPVNLQKSIEFLQNVICGDREEEKETRELMRRQYELIGKPSCRTLNEN